MSLEFTYNPVLDNYLFCTESRPHRDMSVRHSLDVRPTNRNYNLKLRHIPFPGQADVTYLNVCKKCGYKYDFDCILGR